MDYELAKELKEAGFPQIHKNIQLSVCRDKDSEECITPSLSELIEACEEGMELFIGDDGSTSVKTKYHSSQGATPQEAVARLWLALNK